MLKTIAIAAALLLTPPGTPSGGFRWQRIITPPAAGALLPACVVLDAVTFAHAAPALRDLRLFQDGSELPYVIEESFDERSLVTGETSADDRSLYEPAASSYFVPSMRGYIAGLTPSLSEENGELHGFHAGLFLPAHVPVERVRVEPAPDKPEHISLMAHTYPVSTPTMTESGEAAIGPQHPVFPFTIGANLQQEAEVQVDVSGADRPLQRVILEMRRRALCYQPRSASPLTLYLGGGEGMAAKTYNLAGSFSTEIERPLATLGPLVPNPEKQRRPILRNWRSWGLLALIGVSVLLLVLTLRVALRKGLGMHRMN